MKTLTAGSTVDLVLALLPQLSPTDKQRVLKELGGAAPPTPAAVPNTPKQIAPPPAETCRTAGHRFREFAHPHRPAAGLWALVFGNPVRRLYCDRCGEQR